MTPSLPPPRIDFRWPDHATGAVTSSWDDGSVHDRRLVALFREHGFKGTFNLNSGAFSDLPGGSPGCIRSTEVAELYAGQEIAAHTVTHPHLWRLGDEAIFSEMIEDRRSLEELSGRIVRGFVFPFGQNDQHDRLRPLAARAGFRYARASHLSPRHSPPGDFLGWGVSCHCGAALREQWDYFRSATHPDRLFHVWGHGHEFADTLGWAHIERFLREAGALTDLWFATNGEIHDYVRAWRLLEWSLDRRTVSNPSARALDFVADNRPRRLGPGETIHLST